MKMLTVQLLVTTVAHFLLVISHGHAQGENGEACLISTSLFDLCL